MRSRAFVGARLGWNPKDVSIDVVGGHSGTTIVPILSRIPSLPEAEHAEITDKIQNAGTVVVNAKAGKGSATLSMAKAGAQFAISLIKALNGEKGIVECAYVESDVTECQWFATPCELGVEGLEKNLGLPALSAFETEKLAEAITELQPSIAEGKEFVANNA